MLKKLIVTCLLLPFASVSVNAANIVLCNPTNTAINQMSISETEVNSCLASGEGNINGNPKNLQQSKFLQSLAGAGYSLVSKSDDINPYSLSYHQDSQTATLSEGTWTIDPSFWSSYSKGAIGFKFGTGNNPDEWFVFDLVHGISSGDWDFINRHPQGGELSHMNLYGISEVPLPAAFPLFLSVLAMFGLYRRRQLKKA